MPEPAVRRGGPLPTNVWAAGIHCPGSCGGEPQGARPLVVHWDGTTWSQVTSPSPASDNYLSGVTARTAADAWAVGYDGSGTTAYDTLILHWDGTSWSHVSGPSTTPVFNFLFQVSADSAKDAWAVGYYCVNYCENEEIDHSLTLRWNGTTWSTNRDPAGKITRWPRARTLHARSPDNRNNRLQPAVAGLIDSCAEVSCR